MNLENKRIAIIGLGYVGLPLAVEFGKKYSTLGFDINERRIKELNNGLDNTLEVTSEELTSAKSLQFSSKIEELNSSDIYK